MKQVEGEEEEAAEVRRGRGEAEGDEEEEEEHDDDEEEEGKGLARPRAVVMFWSSILAFYRVQITRKMWTMMAANESCLLPCIHSYTHIHIPSTPRAGDDTKMVCLACRNSCSHSSFGGGDGAAAAVAGDACDDEGDGAAKSMMEEEQGRGRR